ncbi:MAG: hypothetical protein Q8869_03370, partial [Candidatus Phytoplasma australasiaticum]|nr:hypothetical protein [Candidatus Phytoplasma australasiaticum]
MARQPSVAGMFNDMCHLPRVLQSMEYVPAPKTFAAEYTALSFVRATISFQGLSALASGEIP